MFPSESTSIINLHHSFLNTGFNKCTYPYQLSHNILIFRSTLNDCSIRVNTIQFELTI